MNHFTRTKRSTSNNRYVEVMMVADRYTTEAYGNFTEQYIMAVVNLVSKITCRQYEYQDLGSIYNI